MYVHVYSVCIGVCVCVCVCVYMYDMIISKYITKLPMLTLLTHTNFIDSSRTFNHIVKLVMSVLFILSVIPELI